MPSAKPGDSFRIHCTGCLAEGSIFDTEEGREPARSLSEGIAPEVGLPLRRGMEDGGTLQVFVTYATTEKVTLNANQPLAGKDLLFDLKRVKID